MAYNPYGHDPRASVDYAEHLSDDPFAGGHYSAQPYSSLPLGAGDQDPEMVDLSSQGARGRPVSDLSSSEAGGASAYWQPGARGSVGGAGAGAAGAGTGYLAGDEWVDETEGQDSWWRRHRWAAIAGILGLLAALAIGLGVGLGVGLNQNSGNKDNAAQLSDGRGSSSTAPGNSVSVGTVVFTSTSFGSNSAEPTTITSTGETTSDVPDPTTSSSAAEESSSSSEDSCVCYAFARALNVGTTD